MENVKLIILFSGKRKTGKDYTSEKLQKRLGDGKCQIIRISEPIKLEWSKMLNLNLIELLGDGPYKEKYRKEMIEWSDKQRAKNYGCFCNEAIKSANREVVIVSDIRRKTDVKFFKDKFGSKVRTIRILCSQDIRKNRGWSFQPGVDDVQSECDLDDYTEWDLVLENNVPESDILIETILETFNIT